MLNRLKTKREIIRDKRDWGMTKTMAKGEAWNGTVNAIGKAFDNKKMTRLVEFASSDLEATAHFLVEGAPIINMTEADEPITIKLPDSTLIHSTHIGNLDIPWMPDNITVAHKYCARTLIRLY